MPALIIWICGLSGAGKSTVADGVTRALEGDGLKVLVLDGDVVRERFHQTLGFTEAEIIENNGLVADLCMENASDFDVILVPIISPIDRARRAVREKVGATFRLAWCNADVDTVAGRDVKGLYSKARNGEISDLIGFSEDGVAFEAPTDAELVLQTGEQPASRSIDVLTGYIRGELAANDASSARRGHGKG